MTANSQPHASTQLTPDIFDMEGIVRTEAVDKQAGSLPNESSLPQPRLSELAKRAKPIHFGLAATAVAMVWIGWPYVFSEGTTTTQSASRLMLSGAPDALPSASSPVPPIVPAPAEPAALPMPRKSADDYPPSLPFAQPLPPELPATKPRSKSLPRRAHTVSQRAQLTAATIGPATTKFSLNTVYTGQAWIQDDERTYVVQAGDTLKGIAIVSIDARERRVMTSQGVIR